ncbi:MAG: hypothetical protein AAF569_06400 [Pseudomonadota bacterium]
MSKFKLFLFTCIGLGLSGFITFLMLEIGLRFLPVAEPLFSQAVTQEQPIARFMPDRTITWSNDWQFSIVNERHINNDGFMNDQNYSANDNKPLMAVIGDSYIEAVMVPYEETLYGRLAGVVGDQKRVYSFGASGAPLSQYLIWARYAKQTYKPSMMVFTIVGNDFDESLPQYAVSQTFHHFAENENGVLEARLLEEYIPSKLRSVIAHSALARYLFFNLKVSQSYNRFKQKLSRQNNAETLYINNVEAFTSEEKLNDSYRAISAFFDLLPSYSGLDPKDIVLAIDAPRRFIYSPDMKPEEKSYFEKTREFFIREGRQKGFTVIDMLPAFSRHYSENSQKFENETDWHWNGLGHDVVHQEILNTGAFRRFMNQTPRLIDY